jgi:hypothetical protein
MARKQLRLHCGVVVIAPLFKKSIVAHPPSGSIQTATYPFAL